MKRKFYSVFLLIFIFASFEALLAKGFLYLVETTSSKVYLFGSIHIAKSSAYPLDSIVESLFRACDNVVFEINLIGLDPFQILEYGTFKDTNTLEKVMPRKYYKIVDSLFKRHSIPKIFYNKMQPWFAVLLLINLDLFSSIDDFVEGIDLYLLKKVDDTKRILEIESITEQINVFKELYELSPEYFFEYFLIQSKQDTSSFDKTYNAWLSGDEKNLISEFSVYSDNPILKKFDFLLNEQRNIKMASRISEYLSTGGSYFVVVGAAHLLGEKGIVSLLKNKGYKLTRLL